MVQHARLATAYTVLQNALVGAMQCVSQRGLYRSDAYKSRGKRGPEHPPPPAPAQLFEGDTDENAGDSSALGQKSVASTNAFAGLIDVT